MEAKGWDIPITNRPDSSIFPLLHWNFHWHRMCRWKYDTELEWDKDSQTPDQGNLQRARASPIGLLYSAVIHLYCHKGTGSLSGFGHGVSTARSLDDKTWAKWCQMYGGKGCLEHVFSPCISQQALRVWTIYVWCMLVSSNLLQSSPIDSLERIQHPWNPYKLHALSATPLLFGSMPWKCLEVWFDKSRKEAPNGSPPFVVYSNVKVLNPQR